MNELRDCSDNFLIKIDELSFEVDALKGDLDVEKTFVYSDKVLRLKGVFEAMKAEAQLINTRQDLVQWNVTMYNELDELEKDFEPYLKLWTLGMDIETNLPMWRKGPFLVRLFSP
jgi:hypothetical protein